MITVPEARKIVLQYGNRLPVVQVRVEDAIGYTLAHDLPSPVDIPAFRQSSMDGYAIRFAERKEKLPVTDSLPAGTAQQVTLPAHSAIQVFTGGPVPEHADTIVQKEWVRREGHTICITSEEVEMGAHIRITGSDIEKGKIALTGGTRVHAMHIGFLSSLGLTTLEVIRKPSVAIIITGNELVNPGTALLPGQVYESNSFSLKACLQQLQVHDVTVYYAKDDLAQTKDAIAKALEKAELVLLTGGVSVGDYDYVAEACSQLAVQMHIHGVKQRPGKPLYFGTKDQVPVFGLPGNPASVLSCFYQYVIPLIGKMTGYNSRRPLKALLDADFEKKPALTFFLKGYHAAGKVSVQQRQASFQLRAFAGANCWIELPEEQSYFTAGTEVIIHPFI